jgi:hypothetical protein
VAARKQLSQAHSHEDRLPTLAQKNGSRPELRPAREYRWCRALAGNTSPGSTGRVEEQSNEITDQSENLAATVLK